MILLDTHVLVWWLSDRRQLSQRARRSIDAVVEDDSLLVSSISTWEIAMLVSRGRLTLTRAVADWVSHIERLRQVRFVPVTNRIAIESVQLPEPLHKDPADRLILATARTFGCAVVTADQKLRDYEPVETIW